MSAKACIVGIDLGTTHTAVAWAPLDEQAQIRDFPLPQLVAAHELAPRKLLPSFLYRPLSDEAVADPWSEAPWVVGEYARERGRSVSGRLVSSAKSWLSHAAVDRTAAILPWGDNPLLDEERLSPVDASARLLDHVKRTWNQKNPELPLEEQQVVLTVPASFDQAARQLTLQAAAQAGLAVRLLEEPQAAFYDYMSRTPSKDLSAQVANTEHRALTVLVCDIGGGTTDLSLIEVGLDADDRKLVDRVAVGKHLLLGGDNLDLALSHALEKRLSPEKLDPGRFSALVAQCRHAKERLLGDDAPASVPISVAGSGAALIGSTLRTELEREQVERLVFDGFFPFVEADAEPVRKRSALIAFGLPYENDAAITRHIASFLKRHAERRPNALLVNGGLFNAPSVRKRVREVLERLTGVAPIVLEQPDPDLAVARGAVAFGRALHGHGLRIGGGSAHGYYVGLDTPGRERKLLCVVPRGAKEAEPYLIRSKPLSLTIGTPVRFELFATESGKNHAPGELVPFDPERFEVLPPVMASFAEGARVARVPVALRGELSAVGTLELSCEVLGPSSEKIPERYALAFELRGLEPEPKPLKPGTSDSKKPRDSSQAEDLGSPGSGLPPSKLGKRFDEAAAAILRIFGKGRQDVSPRETKNLIRELERLLGERRSWNLELSRALFDLVAPKHRARKRSVDHERMYWMLSGYCLRPGFGHPLDRQRVQWLWPLFAEGVSFGDERRNWEQFLIAWRRVCGGLNEAEQTKIRDILDPYLAPSELKLKKPKSFRPTAPDLVLELASWLERVPAKRRGALGDWVLERTWTDRDPRLWAAIGRIGARVPAYASAHYVLAPKKAEEYVDHLLRERWDDLSSAGFAAVQLGRRTDDRARDLSPSVRRELLLRMERSNIRTDWVQAVREFVAVDSESRAELFGEELPVGLSLLEEART